MFWDATPTQSIRRCVRKAGKNEYKLRNVHPHGIIRLTLERFSGNLVFQYFSQIRRENPTFIKIGQG
jgi:hypothetical protein